MRPLNLTLSGFTCFREPTVVSFDDLELFAICGDTGAGKSTLLDAITYALYGQTARLGTRPGESLFSPDLDKLSVQLTFQMGAETYRVARVSERKGARGPKNETRLEHLNAAVWKQLSESEKLKDADRKLEEIVGLTYENFTRAVLLPQGAFDRFLHAKPGERTNLLRDLLGLTVTLEMAKRAGETARDAKTRAQATEERLYDYAHATPERRRELKTELGTLTDEHVGLLGARGTLQERVQQLKVLEGLFGEQAGIRRKLEALGAQEPDVARSRQLLAQAVDADNLLPHLNDLEAHRRKEKGLSEQHAQQQTALGAAEKTFAAAETALNDAERGAQKLPDLAARTEGLAEARLNLTDLKEKGGTLALADEAHEPYTAAAWDAVRARLQQLPTLERARGEVTDVQMRRKQAREAQAATEAQLKEAQTALTTLEAQGKRAKTRREGAETAYDDAVRAAPAAALRPHLHVGEACPVCEQTVAVLPPPITGDLDALQKERVEAVADHERLKEVYSEQRTALKTLEARLNDQAERLERAETDLVRRMEDLATLAAELGEDDPARLRAKLTAAGRALLAGLAASILEKTGGRDPDEAHKALTRERTQLADALQRAQKTLHRAQLESERLSTEAKGLAERLAETTDAHAQAERVFAELLSRTPFADPDALRAAALPAARKRALAETIERYAHDLEQVTREDVVLEARLAGQTFQPGALEAARADYTRTETRLGEVQNRLGALKGETARLEEQLETAKRLRTERAEYEKTASLYGTLARDLQVGNFPAYLLERVQAELAQRASDILKTVTEGRYDLFFRGDEYVVLDAWTGAERSARTLSGGESFITSLALALALSDTLAGSTSLGALFLDEGFGTLDADTLESVAKVLESLTAHGRMVGVITHVAALTERLPDRLVVRKGQAGSVVAWEG